MVFSSVSRSLENVDYAWTNPQTYLVLVPGLSLILRKVQLATTLPLISHYTQQNATQANTQSRKFSNICKWHLRGSIIQIAASIIAIKIFAVSFFSPLAILVLPLAIAATYELADTLITSLRNPITLYEFHPNGNVKSKTITSACNIF